MTGKIAIGNLAYKYGLDEFSNDTLNNEFKGLAEKLRHANEH